MLDTDDKGLQKLLFSPEYGDFQMKYMDDVLSSPAFAPYIENTDCQWLVKGYLSSFLGLFDRWRHDHGGRSRDEFVDCIAGLFTYGIRGQS